MTDDEAINAIQSKMATEWPAASAAAITPYAPDGVLLALDNESFVEPNPPVPYALMAIDHGQAETTGLGVGSRDAIHGTIFVKLAWPAAGVNGYPDNVGFLNKLSECVKGILSKKQWANGPNEDGVITYVATSTDSGQDGPFWILAVLVPFEYAQFR